MVKRSAALAFAAAGVTVILVILALEGGLTPDELTLVEVSASRSPQASSSKSAAAVGSGGRVRVLKGTHAPSLKPETPSAPAVVSASSKQQQAEHHELAQRMHRAEKEQRAADEKAHGTAHKLDQVQRALKTQLANKQTSKWAFDASEQNTLIFLRHSVASMTDPQLTDVERPLTAEGRIEARGQGLAFAARRPFLLPDVIVCSPSVRTRETLNNFIQGVLDSPLLSHHEKEAVRRIPLLMDARLLPHSSTIYTYLDSIHSAVGGHMRNVTRELPAKERDQLDHKAQVALLVCHMPTVLETILSLTDSHLKHSEPLRQRMQSLGFPPASLGVVGLDKGTSGWTDATFASGHLEEFIMPLMAQESAKVTHT